MLRRGSSQAATALKFSSKKLVCDNSLARHLTLFAKKNSALLDFCIDNLRQNDAGTFRFLFWESKPTNTMQGEQPGHQTGSENSGAINTEAIIRSPRVDLGRQRDEAGVLAKPMHPPVAHC